MLAKRPKGATAKRQPSSASGLLWMFVGAVLTLMIGVFLYLSPLFDFKPAATTEPERQVQPKVSTSKDDGDYEFYDILPNQEMATIPDENILDPTQAPSSNPFEPDVVVVQPRVDGSTSSQDNANGQANGNNDASQNREPAVSGDDDIVIIEENSTYEGTPSQNNQNNAAPNPATQNRTGAEATGASIQRSAPATTYILQINSFGNADEADHRRAQVLMAGVDAKVIKNTTANGAPIYQVVSRPMDNRKAVSGAQQRLQNNGIDSIIVEQRR
ncbi:SPOR domain-containing protein [Psychrobacter ciconiae]|uniref:SPOR domain-containing protein n=1 Tax=Psychrobacter ciconiae TaxID=1553449 RepID=UPI00191B679F|nr:SPOR domain-containing protein [Psychrobacter ciconiae]